MTLSVVLCWVSFMLNVIMLSFTNNPFMVSVFMLNVVMLTAIMLNAMAPLFWFKKRIGYSSFQKVEIYQQTCSVVHQLIHNPKFGGSYPASDESSYIYITNIAYVVYNGSVF